MAEQSLKDKTVKGTFWSGIDNMAQFGVTFIVSIILARLLTPDDYGLIGIVTIFTSVCTVIINSGFTNALIRKNDVTDDDYNTSFIVNLLMSFLLYAIIFVCSPLIANFFHKEELTALTRVSSLGMIIGAFSLVQQTIITKCIDFRTQAIITIIASITSGCIGVVLALVGFGVWALVIQGLSAQLLRTIMLWVFNTWMPKLRFSTASFHELFGFGWKMVISGVIDTVWAQLNQVVIGRFYNPASLGQYTRANQFSSLFSSNLTSVVQRVTFPVLSNIQDDKDRMISAYRHIIKITMYVTAISMFFLGAVSEPLLYCLIGPQWHDAAVYLPIICISSSMFPLHAINLNMLQVQGRSDLFLGLEIIKKTIAIAPLLIGIFVGIIPMLYANIVLSIICFFLNSYYTGKLLGYSSWMQIRDIAPSYGIASVVSVFVYFLKFIPLSYWIILPMQIVLGCSLILLICEKKRVDEYMEIKRMIKPYLFIKR